MWMKNPDPRIKPPLGSIIDWSHPLADGLVGCWLFNEGTGNIATNLAKYELPGNLINSPLWGDNGVHTDGARNYIRILDNGFYSKDEFTVIFTGIIYKYAQYDRLICHKGDLTWDSTEGWHIEIYNNNLITFVGSGGDYGDRINFPINLNEQFTLTITKKRGENLVRAYKNGRFSDNQSCNNIAKSSQPLDFGYYSNEGRYIDGLFERVLYYQKVLPDDLIQADAFSPYSFIVWPSHTTIFDLAPGGSLIQRQAQAPVSWRRYYLKGAALNISSTIPAGRQAQAPVSYNKELSRLFSIPAAMLLTVNKEGTALFEALDSVSREAEFPVDWFSSTLVVAGKEIPISAVRYVSKMADAPLEGLVVTEKARELSYSWLLSISRDAVIPTDWQGALLVTKDVVLPVDFARLLLKGGSTSLDWTHPLESPKEAVVEFLKMVQGAEAPFPLEVLSGLKEDITASLDWIRSVLSEKDLGPTWLVFRSIDEEVCLSWVVPVAEEKDFDLSWLKGIAKSAGLPVEVAGKAVRVEMLRFRPKVPRMRAVFRIKDSQIKLN